MLSKMVHWDKDIGDNGSQSLSRVNVKHFHIILQNSSVPGSAPVLNVNESFRRISHQ